MSSVRSSGLGLEFGQEFPSELFSGALGRGFEVDSLRTDVTEMEASSSSRFHGPWPAPFSEEGDQAVLEEGFEVRTETFPDGLVSLRADIPRVAPVEDIPRNRPNSGPVYVCQLRLSCAKR